MTSFRLRPIDRTEWRRLWELDRVCFPPPQAFPQVEFRRLLQVTGAFAVAAEPGESGELAGFVLALPEAGRGHVITIDVAPAWRRHGVGSELLAAAERHFRERGAGGMRLEVAVNNHPALAFYARRGYLVRKTLPGYYASDLDGLWLELNWPAQ